MVSEKGNCPDVAGGENLDGGCGVVGAKRVRMNDLDSMLRSDGGWCLFLLFSILIFFGDIVWLVIFFDLDGVWFFLDFDGVFCYFYLYSCHWIIFLVHFISNLNAGDLEFSLLYEDILLPFATLFGQILCSTFYHID